MLLATTELMRVPLHRSLVKALPKDVIMKYEVVVVSPRNYFCYTPLLPAVATGTIEERSVIEPVRHFIRGKAGALYGHNVPHALHTSTACTFGTQQY